MSLKAEAEVSLTDLAKQTVREAKDVAKVYRVIRVLEPLRGGDPTEVLFMGRRSGTHAVVPLTAVLIDDPPGFEPDPLIRDGW